MFPSTRWGTIRLFVGWMGVEMELRTLGTVEMVGDDGSVVDIGGARPLRLLLALWVDSGQPQSLDRLSDRCFGDQERPEDPVPALRVAVRRLRAALGDDVIETTRGGYRLVSGALLDDRAEFERLVARGRAATDPVAAASAFRLALDLWRGRPFADLDDVEWLMPERQRLEEIHLLALEGHFDGQLSAGRATEIVGDLQLVAAEHPLRERFHRQLMRALFLADRQPEALRVFQTHRENLVEAGLEPGPEIVELERTIALGDRSGIESAPPRALRSYEIHERLGEGAFSIVYLGVQPSVGREVAIKQIRSELADRPEFIRRFEAEAHMVARLEHPHIVPLYDFWREPGSAYLVMRLLRAGNLESSLRSGPWSLERVQRLVHQVGSALTAAHRAGFVHRDVKPANILLDDEGFSYLTDFGIALEAAELATPEAALSAGSPAYASPEQLRREPVGPPADVHGLAIAAFEALTGRLPFPDEPDQASLLRRQLNDPIPPVRHARTDVPPELDRVLAKATAKQPADRYPTIEEFVAAFDAALDDRAAPIARPRDAFTLVQAEARNPYKGLRAFDASDSADFAGRRRLVDQLIAALEANRLVAVVGPSGSGKSSVVRAGLIPALRAGGLPRSDQWFVSTLLPGAHPFEEMEAALVRIAPDRPAGLLGLLREGQRGLARALRQVLPDGAELLLVIDQFEELFTLCEDEQERQAFLAAVAVAATEERSRLRVVLTLRADFFDRPLRYESIGRLVRDGTVPVLPLAADELERAIVDPALAQGGEFEPGLVSEIVADVADQPGALPLLQYALTELWERRVSGLLTRDAYRELGGVAGALGRRAESLFVEASGDEQAALRRVFGRLVSLGEGVEDTRRRALRSELGAAPAVDAVVERFGQARLLSFDRDEASREQTVEVAHEALIREWPRLRKWLEEDRDGLRVLRHLHAAARDWDAAGRPSSELYRGGRLEAAEAWRAEHAEELTEVERAFVDSSVAARTAAQDAERAQLEAERRSNRRLRGLLGGVAVLLVFSMVAGLLAFQERENARETAFEAETGRLVAQAGQFAASNPRLAALLAVAAYQRDQSPAELGGLQTVLASSAPVLGYLGWGTAYLDVEFVSDDRFVGVRADGLDLFDAVTGEQLDELAVSLEFSQDFIASMNNANQVVAADDAPVVALREGGEAVVLGVSDQFEELGRWPVDGAAALAIRFDGQRFAAVGDGGVQIIDRSTQRSIEVELPPSPDSVDMQIPEPQADRFAFGADYWARFPVRRSLLTENSGLFLLEGIELSVFDWEGTRRQGPTVLTADNGEFISPVVPRSITEAQGVLRFESANTISEAPVDDPLDTATARTIPDFFGTGNPDVVASSWSDRGHVVVTDDGSIHRIDDASNVVTLAQPPAVAVTEAVIVGDRAVMATPEGLLVVSTLNSPALARGFGRPVLASSASVSRNGRFVAAGPAGGPGSGAIWDAATGEELGLVDDRGAPYYVAFPPHLTEQLHVWSFDPERGNVADHLVSTEDGWDLSYTVRDPRPGNGGDVNGAVTVGFDDIETVVFDSYTQQVIADLDAANTADVTFDPMRDRVFVGSWFGEARLYDTETWVPIAGGVPADAAISFANWSSDGELVATIGFGANATMQIRDGETFETLRSIDLPSGGQQNWSDASLIFSDDKSLLLSTVDGVGRLWDVEAGEAIGVPFPNDPRGNPGANWGEYPQLVTVNEHAVLLWNLDTEQWPEIACQFAGSNMTRAEWEQWGPRDEPYRAVCPQWKVESQGDQDDR